MDERQHPNAAEMTSFACSRLWFVVIVSACGRTYIHASIVLFPVIVWLSSHSHIAGCGCLLKASELVCYDTQDVAVCGGYSNYCSSGLEHLNLRCVVSKTASRCDACFAGMLPCVHYCKLAMSLLHLDATRTALPRHHTLQTSTATTPELDLV